MAETRPAEIKPRNELTVLAPLLALYTTAYLGVQIAEFALRGAVKTPAGMMAIYVSLLGAYAADKEIRRWVGRQEPARRGSVFVVLWLTFFLAAWLIRAFRPELALPGDLTPVALQVVGIFFGSRASKQIFETRHAGALAQSRQERILELIAERGQITRQEVVGAVQVSRRTANRLLDELARSGRIVKQGAGRGACYARGKDA